MSTDRDRPVDLAPERRYLESRAPGLGSRLGKEDHMRPPPSPAVRRSLAAACAVSLVGLTLSGCSSSADDPEPVVDQQAASATPTPTPSADPSPAPEPWERRTQAGAVAFVEHWVKVFNEASDSGETDALRTLSAADCQSCNRLITAIDDLYAAGGSIVSDGWAVQQIGLLGDPNARSPEVAVAVRQKAQTVNLPDGDVQEFEESSATYSASLVWHKGGWKVQAFEGVG